MSALYNRFMRWIFLSPHFDDIVLSCGGLIWDQVQAGRLVEAWTVCAGQPATDVPLSGFAQQLHLRWQTGPEAVEARRSEDEAALKRLGVTGRYWDLPDCIYRTLPGGRWVVNGEEDLWLEVDPLEEPVMERLSDWLVADLAADDLLISPLTLGGHVDHRLVRAAAEHAAQRAGCGLSYYADYPYVARSEVFASRAEAAWDTLCQPVSRRALAAWQAAVACYTSQISTFWGGLEEMRAEIKRYWQSGGGSCLWQRPDSPANG